jgi:hypothetical protein
MPNRTDRPHEALWNTAYATYLPNAKRLYTLFIAVRGSLAMKDAKLYCNQSSIQRYLTNCCSLSSTFVLVFIIEGYEYQRNADESSPANNAHFQSSLQEVDKAHGYDSA